MSRTAVATHARIAGHPCSGERQSHNAHQKSIYITHTSHPICYRGNDHGPGWPVQPWCVAEPDTTGIRQGCLVCSPEQRHGETRQARVPRLVGMSRWARRGCEVRIAMEPLGHVTRRPAPYGRSLGSRCAGSASIRVRASDPGRPVRHSPTTRSGRGDAGPGSPLHGVADADRRPAGSGGIGTIPVDGPGPDGGCDAGPTCAPVAAAAGAERGVRRGRPDGSALDRCNAGGGYDPIRVAHPMELRAAVVAGLRP